MLQQMAQAQINPWLSTIPSLQQQINPAFFGQTSIAPVQMNPALFGMSPIAQQILPQIA
jgi:hypothetical protein